MIVMEVCHALINRLRFTFNLPETEEAWKSVASAFWEKCDMPNCLGAIDGKHIKLKKPKFSGSHYRNYKGFESIVLMAITDANGIFRYVDVGTNGRISDAGIWDRCAFKKKLHMKQLRIPGVKALPGSDACVPHYFIGDEAFPLGLNLMKPYADKLSTDGEKVFNYRLSRARRVVECSFGMLANKFRILLTDMYLEPSKAISVVLAACSLHNFLQKVTNRSTSVSRREEETSDTRKLKKWAPTDCHNPTKAAKKMRETLKEYFLSDAGSLSWQWSSARVKR